MQPSAVMPVFEDMGGYRRIWEDMGGYGRCDTGHYQWHWAGRHGRIYRSHSTACGTRLGSGLLEGGSGSWAVQEKRFPNIQNTP